MKTLVLTLGVLLVSMTAFADGFDIEKGGKTFRCEESQDSGSNAATCSDKAYHGPFSKDESVQLCAGSRSDAPADCALKAYSGVFNKDEAIQLCKGARSTGPVECAQQAYSGVFSKDEAVKLCQRSGNLDRAKCAQNAYSGPYSKDEALKLCSGPHANLVMRSLNLIASSPELQSKVASLKQKTLQAERH